MMKNPVMWLICFLLVFSQTANAGDDATDFSLSNGLKVIFLPIRDNEVVALRFYLPGSAARQTERNAGIETMLLDAMTYGSGNFPKEKKDRILDRFGSHIGGQVRKDFSRFGLSSIRPFFKITLEIFADALKNPTLDPKDVELVRQKQLARIRAKLDSPDDFLSKVLNDSFYKGHPYHNDVDGTIESATAINVENLRAYSEELLHSADSFIVVAGNLEKVDLKEWLENSFGDLKRNRLQGLNLPDFNPDTKALTVAEKDIPTKYILGKFAAPVPQNEDYAALEIGMDFLSDRLWETVRTKKGLAYAVSSGLGANVTNYGYFYMNTIDESATMQLVFAEMEKIKKTLIPKDELKSTKAVYFTRYYQGMESNENQAGFMAFGEIYFGDYRKRHSLLESVKAVSAEEIRRVMNKYVTNVKFAVVGKEGSISEGAFASPEIEGDSGIGKPEE